MFNFIVSLFMNTTADAAFEAAIYSVGFASKFGMYQPEEPAGLQAAADEFKKSHT